MNILNRLFPHRVEVRVAEAPHATLHGRLAEPDWKPMTEQELLGYERKILVSTIDDLQSKVQTLHDLIIHGPGRHDRQVGFLADLLDNDLQKLRDRIERGAGGAPQRRPAPPTAPGKQSPPRRRRTGICSSTERRD